MLFWKQKRKEEQADRGEAQTTLAAGTAILADVLAPDGYLVDDDMVHVGPDRVVRVAYVSDVPGKVSMGWLRELFAGDVDVTISIAPLPIHVVIKDLTDTIQALNTQLYLDTERGSHAEQSPKTHVRDALWALRDDIQTSGNRMYQVSILAAVAARDRESLVKRYKTVEERLAGTGVTIRCAYPEQNAAFKAARPYGGGMVWQDCRRNFDLYSAVTLMPFYSADLFHKGSVLLGKNLTTGGPMAVLTGYVSHLVLDTFNPAGVPWLWPCRFRLRVPAVQTGSILERLVVMPIVFVVAIYLIGVHAAPTLVYWGKSIP
jgi:hypothetical protein